jgi:hypothetical protein
MSKWRKGLIGLRWMLLAVEAGGDIKAALKEKAAIVHAPV